MNWKHALLSIAVLALCVYLPATSAGALTSPLESPLSTPDAPCGTLGCTVTGGIETCAWLLPDSQQPQRWQYEMIAQHECTFVSCPAMGAYVLTCWWDAPTPIRDDEPGHIDGEVTCTPTPAVFVSPLVSPLATPAFSATLEGSVLTDSRNVPAAPVPEPTTAPSTWQDAGDLWMGTYRLLINERGDYCVPELAGCG